MVLSLAKQSSTLLPIEDCQVKVLSYFNINELMNFRYVSKRHAELVNQFFNNPEYYQHHYHKKITARNIIIDTMEQKWRSTELLFTRAEKLKIKNMYTEKRVKVRLEVLDIILKKKASVLLLLIKFKNNLELKAITDWTFKLIERVENLNSNRVTQKCNYYLSSLIGCYKTVYNILKKAPNVQKCVESIENFTEKLISIDSLINKIKNDIFEIQKDRRVIIRISHEIDAIKHCYTDAWSGYHRLPKISFLKDKCINESNESIINYLNQYWDLVL